MKNILGWKIVGTFPDIKKSVIIFAPHTSYYDALYGKLYMMITGVSYKFLSKKEFFRFPLKYLFQWFGSIPVEKNREYIVQITERFNSSDELHICLSPEGQFAKTTRWKKGFFYMAQSAGVPIIVGSLDYRRKEIGVKGVIDKVDDFQEVILEINALYRGVTAKYPDDFALDNRFS